MSTSTRIVVTVEELQHHKKEVVLEAIRREWDPYNVPPEDYGSTEDEIPPHRHEHPLRRGRRGGFAVRVARAIWQANGGYCPIWVDAQPDDEAPCDTIELSRDDYDRLRDEGESPTAVDCCPDCGALPGENHRDDCDVEPCATCGRQRARSLFPVAVYHQASCPPEIRSAAPRPSNH